MTRALPAVPITALAFVAALLLAATAMRAGLIADDAIRLWAGASSAGSGDVLIGRIAAAYPTIPFLSTTLITLIMPNGTPAPIVMAAVVFALLIGFWFIRFRSVGFPLWASCAATLLIGFHPVMLRAVIGGPADVFLAVFLFMNGSELFDLRGRSATSEVMAVRLALFMLTFCHPMGAAITFAAVPFLVFAVRPVLVANSPLNVIVALMFPTVFGICAFIYVSWIFPGAGWSYFAAPAESLSAWTVGIARILGDGFPGRIASMPFLAIGAPLLCACRHCCTRLGHSSTAIDCTTSGTGGSVNHRRGDDGRNENVRRSHGTGGRGPRARGPGDDPHTDGARADLNCHSIAGDWMDRRRVEPTACRPRDRNTDLRGSRRPQRRS